VIPEQVIDYQLDEATTSITTKDAILYALGLGFSRTMDDKDLKYTYENYDKFCMFPTIATTKPFVFCDDNIHKFMECPGFPRFNIAKLLHFE